MAMWMPGRSKCPICGRPVMDESDFIAFTCLGTLPHEYDRIDDGVVHQSCLSRWERRDDFVKHWNMAVRLSTLDSERHLLVVENQIVRYKNE